MNNYILKINCKDKPGIISSVSNFLFKNKYNILESSQFRDVKSNNFFMRVHFKSITRFHIQYELNTPTLCCL